MWEICFNARKLLEENIEKTLLDIIGKDHQSIGNNSKTKQMQLMKLRSLFARKETTEWRGIQQNGKYIWKISILKEVLYPEYINNIKNQKIENPPIQLSNGQKTSKEEIEIANKYLEKKKRSVLLGILETQVKTMMKYHHTAMWMVETQRLTNPLSIWTKVKIYTPIMEM